MISSKVLLQDLQRTPVMRFSLFVPTLVRAVATKVGQDDANDNSILSPTLNAVLHWSIVRSFFGDGEGTPVQGLRFLVLALEGEETRQRIHAIDQGDMSGVEEFLSDGEYAALGLFCFFVSA
jgi:hypothetical protein